MTFLNQPAFYFATIRKIHTAFGALFRNVSVRRFSESGGKGTVGETIRVPLMYGPTEKWMAKLNQHSQASDNFNIAKALPRMSFELVNMQYDQVRQLSPVGEITDYSQLTPDEFVRQLNPAPWDFHYQLNIMTKTLDDGFQIIEQICPNFTPSQNLNVKDIPELRLVKDIPIIFSGISASDTYEGESQNVRAIIWTMDFVVKGYLYPGISDSAIIKKIFTDIYTNSEMEVLPPPTSQIVVQVDPLAALETDDWTIATRINEPPTPYELPVHTLAPTRGAYTITGHDVNMTKNVPLTAAGGSLVITGNSVTFRLGKALFAETGSYILSGEDATLTKA